MPIRSENFSKIEEKLEICSTWNNYVNTYARSRETFCGLNGLLGVINGPCAEEVGGGVFPLQQGAVI